MEFDFTTNERKHTQLEDLFAKACRIPNVKLIQRGYSMEEVYDIQINEVVERFKKKVFKRIWLFSSMRERESRKSLDELADILFKTGIVSSIEEGKRTVPLLIKEEGIRYDSFCGALFFREIENVTSGQRRYLIADHKEEVF